MSTVLDVYYDNSLKHLKEFHICYDSFSRDNAKKLNHFRFSIYTQIPIDVFSHLIDVIHNAILLYDNYIVDSANLTREDKGFMSAIKCVENILKHTKNPPEITDLITSTPQMSSNILLVTNPPQWTTNAKLISTWNDISFLTDVLPSQRNNYNQYLKGQELLSSLEKLEEKIRYYYR